MRCWPWFFSIVLMWVGSGCAGLLNKGRQTLVLESVPSGATLHLNGRELGTTPYTYSYNLDDGEILLFEYHMAGYGSAGVEMHPYESAGVLLADAMLFHVPYIVDHKNPATYRMPVERYTINLYREIGPDATRYLVPVSGLRSSMNAKSELGTVAGRPAKMDRGGPYHELMYPEQLAGAIQNGLRGTWIDARQVRAGSSKGDDMIQRAKMHLRPEIVSFKGQLEKRSNRFSGPVEIGVNWQFLSATTKDSVVLSVPMTTTYHAAQARSRELVEAAMGHAARTLADDPALPEKLAKLYGTGLARSKGGEVALRTPAPIRYDGRKQMIAALVKAVGTVQVGNGHGSGFMITNDGYMITNEHVVGREPVVKVRFEQGFTLDAQVLKVNKDFDLALLKVPATDMVALTIGDDKGLMLGEELYAIGTPVDAALGQSVSRGILSGHRELEGRTYLQTDVSINPGNSGGPLIDEDGRVVGVTTMKLSGRGLEGLGFAVPISVALEMLNIRMEP